jgi:hypothetical protein
MYSILYVQFVHGEMLLIQSVRGVRHSTTLRMRRIDTSDIGTRKIK